jgi:hypothetical protein
MPDYMFFMHDDVRDGENDWEPYLTKLKAKRSFEGGSAIGNGVCVRKGGEVPSLTAHLTGYIRVNADDLDHARSDFQKSADIGQRISSHFWRGQSLC